MVLFFVNDPATPKTYTLSLHDALPIFGPVHFEVRAVRCGHKPAQFAMPGRLGMSEVEPRPKQDRKSTRLNSSHANISYAVFCLKKKNSPQLIGLEPKCTKHFFAYRSNR